MKDILVLTFFFLFTSFAGADQNNFSYAGLDLNLTPKDLLRRFPHSLVDKGKDHYYIHVSPSDARDHILAVNAGLDKGKIRSLRIFFEEHSKAAPCQPILDAFIRSFGRPARTMNYFEEKWKHHVKIWRSKNERLYLDCGSFENGKNLVVEDVKIVSVEDPGHKTSSGKFQE